MFFKIDDSIIDLLNQVQPPASIGLCIDELFRARRLGQHLIYCKPSNLEKIESFNGISEATKLTIKKIKQQQRFKKAAFESMTTYVNVIATPNTIRKSILGNKTVIEISIDQLANGDFLDATTLLAENLTDCEFYQNITNITNRSNSALTSLRHRLNYVSGGGSQTPRQYRQQKANKSLTLCIVDGDIEYQNAPLGTNTAAPIHLDEIANPVPHCASLILSCYSIENLIPTKIIINATNPRAPISPYLSKITQYQDEQFWPYIPLKLGKNCSNFVGNTPKSIYWGSQKQHFAPLNAACQSWNNGVCAQPCEVLEKMPGKTAQIVTEYLSAAKLNGQLSEIANTIAPLPLPIKQLWENISHNLNSWVCSGDRITAY
ncbi:hypothetical protein [Pseudomonas sp. GL-RE-29]|uniref:hypothetical protein n=1 Tax=Pseudomonas sp. GL-RE-29 TaxID=2832375 RepID=UPI001CBC8E22|nr:hypothetical protein [Pseudomonas sp. GL-RE-29]